VWLAACACCEDVQRLAEKQARRFIYQEKTMAEFLRSLTPEFFDTLVIIVIIIGLALAGVRLYSDFTRKLPSERPPKNDTRHPPQA
jgi:hypothetical protein